MNALTLNHLTEQLPDFRGARLITSERGGHWTASLVDPRTLRFLLSFGGDSESEAVRKVEAKLNLYIASRRAA